MSKYGFLLPFTLPLLAFAGFFLGGLWNFMLPVFAYYVVPLLDMLAGLNTWSPAARETAALERNPYYRLLLYVYVPLHYAVLLTAVWLVTQHAQPWYALVGITLTTGTVTGGLGITVAHELGHKTGKLDRWLSRTLLLFVCYMHFYIEHNRGHHARVGTPDDAASARYGEMFYRFVPRDVEGARHGRHPTRCSGAYCCHRCPLPRWAY